MNELLSYCFIDKSGNILEEKNSELPMIPASNTKIITAYSAFKHFGPKYEFKTYGLSQNDNLIISGGPSFFLSENEIKNKLNFPNNITNIIFKDQVIDNDYYNKCWEIGDNNYSYQPKITNFFFFENCNNKKNENILNHEIENDYIPLIDPEIYTIKHILKNINFNKEFSDNILLINKAKIKDVLFHIMKYSCNFYAEVLFKSISYEKDKPGTWANSIKIVNKDLQDLNLKHFDLYDGSGLCMANLISTYTISNIVKNGYEQFKNDFINIFPLPDEGTLKNRLLNLKEYKIFAKTGTVRHVSSLSGYISSKEIYFSIILNNSLKNNYEREQTIDNVLNDFIIK